MHAKVRHPMTKIDKLNMPLRVAVVEDNARTRTGLAQLLESAPGIKCVAACGSADEAVRVIPGCRPQVVLMDINLPGMSGIQCTALLKAQLPKTQVLMLTAYSDNDYVFEALKAGASGYLLKSIAPEDLLDSIQEVVDGGAPMNGMIARQVIEAFRKPSGGPTETPLTARENEILGFLSRGYSNKEIAARLELSTGTVSVHLEHIYAKLHVRCRTEAAAKYLGSPTVAPQPQATMA